MLKLENSIRGLSFSRVAFDLTIQENKNENTLANIPIWVYSIDNSKYLWGYRYKLVILLLMIQFSWRQLWQREAQ